MRAQSASLAAWVHIKLSIPRQGSNTRRPSIIDLMQCLAYAFRIEAFSKYATITVLSPPRAKHGHRALGLWDRSPNHRHRQCGPRTEKELSNATRKVPRIVAVPGDDVTGPTRCDGQMRPMSVLSHTHARSRSCAHTHIGQVFRKFSFHHITPCPF